MEYTQTYNDAVTLVYLMFIAIYILICVIAGILAILAGRTKQHGAAFSFAFGFFLNVIGIIILAILPSKNTESAKNSEALVNYKKLLDNGGITQEEFEAKKLELLARK